MQGPRWILDRTDLMSRKVGKELYRSLQSGPEEGISRLLRGGSLKSSEVAKV